MSPSADALDAVLEQARRRGLLGGDPSGHVRHSDAFVTLIERWDVELPGGATVLDLGSGGGVPGLVVASRLPHRDVVLLEASERRCRFLEWAVGELGLSSSVDVVHGRAEVLARGALRERCAVVTARSFGPPGATAECARGFLRPGGRAVVSEPPIAGGRWPGDALATLGYGPSEQVMVDGQGFSVLEAVGSCPESIPRRDGLPRKRPLF